MGAGEELSYYFYILNERERKERGHVAEGS